MMRREKDPVVDNYPQSKTDVVMNNSENKSTIKNNEIEKTEGDELVDDTDSLVNEGEDSENIVVKRDEFILSKPIEIINFDFKGSNKNQNKSDSLLALNTGIKDNKKAPNDPKFIYMVEYWQSPLNYKGYRLGVNKFVFFGLDPDEPISAYFWKGNYYLKWRDNFYFLQENDGFESFEKVNQPELISLTQ